MQPEGRRRKNGARNLRDRSSAAPDSERHATMRQPPRRRPVVGGTDGPEFARPGYTPPNDRATLARAAPGSDAVLAPVKPTCHDVVRLQSRLEALLEVERQRGQLDAAILFTHWNARVAEELLEARFMGRPTQ